MLFHTHTWILREFVKRYARGDTSPDIYIYNVIPDILPIHESITSQMTHRIPRFRDIPADFRKALFVQFHLMVDDVAHYGAITAAGSDAFDANPGGYAYEKGKDLVPRILELHQRIKKPISMDSAIYRSHMMVEMAFDLLLFEREGSLVSLLTNALDHSLQRNKPEMVSTLHWLLNIPARTLENAIDHGFKAYGGERIQKTMSLEGRTRLYIEKFDYDSDDGEVWSGVEGLVRRGMELSEDYELFLSHTLDIIRKAGFVTRL